MKGNPGCFPFFFGDETLPSYVGIFFTHQYKDIPDN